MGIVIKSQTKPPSVSTSKGLTMDRFDCERLPPRAVAQLSEGLLQQPPKNNTGERQKPKNFMYTDKPIKIFVCLFFGIIPRLFMHHKRKLCSALFSICIVAFQWYSVAGYIYCTKTFWSVNATVTNSSRTDQKTNLPEIPLETAMLLLGLSASGAITVTMAVWYFYTSTNNFSDRDKNSFFLIPRIYSCDDFDYPDLCDFEIISPKEWLVTNILFIVGMLSVFFVLGTDFGTDTLFDFYGIRAFLKHTTPTNQLIYSLAVAMLFWGFAATVCACCIFHIMSRHLIAFMDNTQRRVLDSAITRQEFFNHHEKLIIYTQSMICKFKYWFAVHNAMFILLLAAMIFEWIAFMKQSKYQHNFLLSQTAGTILVCYKFAFPFFSASRVTVKFKDFYLTIVRSNKFSDIPEMLLLQNHFGFEIFGLRITPNVAVIVFLSSFVGLLKFFSSGV